jgi:hypothetical protein
LIEIRVASCILNASCHLNLNFAKLDTMKLFLIILGSAGGLLAVFGVIQFVRTMMTNDAGTAYGSSDIIASAVPVFLGLAICVVCFQRAFRRPK